MAHTSTELASREAELAATAAASSIYLPLASVDGIAWQEGEDTFVAWVDGILDYEAANPGEPVTHEAATRIQREILANVRGEDRWRRCREAWDRELLDAENGGLYL